MLPVRKLRWAQVQGCVGEGSVQAQVAARVRAPGQHGQVCAAGTWSVQASVRLGAGTGRNSAGSDGPRGSCVCVCRHSACKPWRRRCGCQLRRSGPACVLGAHAVQPSECVPSECAVQPSECVPASVCPASALPMGHAETRALLSVLSKGWVHSNSGLVSSIRQSIRQSIRPWDLNLVVTHAHACASAFCVCACVCVCVRVHAHVCVRACCSCEPQQQWASQRASPLPWFGALLSICACLWIRACLCVRCGFVQSRQASRRAKSQAMLHHPAASGRQPAQACVCTCACCSFEHGGQAGTHGKSQAMLSHPATQAASQLLAEAQIAANTGVCVCVCVRARAPHGLRQMRVCFFVWGWVCLKGPGAVAIKGACCAPRAFEADRAIRALQKGSWCVGVRVDLCMCA